MTVTEKSSRKVIVGAGWANPLTHDYVIESASWVHVFADTVELVQGVDYTVTNVLNPAGYAVTIAVPGSWAPTSWVLNAVPPIDQQKDLTVGGTFGAKYEDGLDKISRRLQYVWDLARRGLKTSLLTPVGEDPYTLPVPSADSLIGWNNAATNLENKTVALLGGVIVDNDTAMALDSATRVPSQHAAKTYTNAALAAAAAYTDAAIVAIKAGVTAAYDTLSEIAAALPASILTTRGDIIFRNATVPARLAASTAGYLLQTNGPGTDPSYAGFLQAGANAATRTWQNKARDFVSVKDFGAVGDGATDDAAAFQAAFTASGYVYIPAGEYKLNSTITVSNKAVFIQGSGVQNTILKFAASTNGFSISQNSGAYPVNVSDVTIATLNDPASQTANAFTITWPTGWADRFSLKGTMNSVEFRGYSLSANGWTNGVHITQGLNFLFEYCSFIGKDTGLPSSSTQATTTVSTAAIIWDGGWYPTDFKVSHCYFNAWLTGVSVGGATEGVSVIDTTFVYLFSGIVWHTGTFDAGLGGGNAAGRPLLLVRGSHFNVFARAVDTDGVVQIQIHDNDIYHSNIATSAANLINLAHGSDALVHHNIFRKYVASATAAANAIVIGDASTGFANCTIENNDIATAAPSAFDTGVWFRSDCSASFEKFNIFGAAFNTAAVFDQGTNNKKGAVTSGAIIGRAYAEYTANADLTVAIPLDNTIPQNTEGTQILSLTYVPQSALNRIRLTFMGEGCIASAGAAIAASLFIDSGANAVQAMSSQGTAATRVPIMMTYEYLPGNITSHTYNVRVGGNTGTIRMNGSLTTTDFGAGLQKCTLVLEEIQG